MPRYVIEHDALVELLALVCAHGILGERGDSAEADELLEKSNDILEHCGVKDITELNEEIGLALALLVPGEFDGREPA